MNWRTRDMIRVFVVSRQFYWSFGSQPRRNDYSLEERIVRTNGTLVSSSVAFRHHFLDILEVVQEYFSVVRQFILASLSGEDH